MTSDGVRRFARFAFPPNQLGYCGPDDAGSVLEYVDAGVTDRGLVEIAQAFHGAWPYLELIAHANNIEDPLDDRVVSAYWLGNDLLGRVPGAVLALHIAGRFGPRTTMTGRQAFDEAALEGSTAHHNFHVFSVYPWVGLLRSGIPDEPLRIIDRCRIRWGQVLEANDTTAVVESRPLEFREDRLGLGEPRAEIAWTSENGYRLTPNVKTGDLVAMHWDWICDVIDPPGVERLACITETQLTIANRTHVPV